MDNEVNGIEDIDRSQIQSKESGFLPELGNSNTLEFRETMIQGNVNVEENKTETFPNVLDGNNHNWVSTSNHTCASPRHTDNPGVSVEELIVNNFNSGKLEIVGASNMRDKIQGSGGTNPVVRQDSDSVFFSEFLDKEQEDQNQNQNEKADRFLEDEKQLSPGGIRTKVISKSGFSNYIVKNTLKGKGVIFRGPARDGVGVQVCGQSDTFSAPSAGIPESRPSVSPSNNNISLREWLTAVMNKVDKSRSLFIFKQILDLVDSLHSQGVALQALRPSCFRLSSSNHVSYLGLPQKEITNIDIYGNNRNSFGRWRQFPNEEHVSIGGDLLEEQWYASPEDLRERCSTLSSNVYSLGVLLFELLGSFESAREHVVAMMNLRQRILPPIFLSENPKEAGYCLWLLHPEASRRPTTRDVLKSKLVSGIEEISTDELLSTIVKEEVESELVLDFLASLIEQKQKCATNLVEDINCIEFDITETLSRRADNTTYDTYVTSSPFSNLRESSLIESNLSHLETAYFSVRSSVEVLENDTTSSFDHKVFTSRENNYLEQNIKAEEKPLGRRGIFFDGLCKYARFSKFEVCGNLRNGDFSSSANVICSLGFDRDEDYFATAGVSKKIKVYDYHMLLDDSVDIHYPVVEMSNESKLSCICWNSYIKNYLASTDYDGVVKLWDIGSGQAVSHHIEHERRAWSVDFSRVDPTKLASGSDDCYVKLWSINEKKSISTIRSIANVCCVQFSPYSAHLLSFGSADYRTYCYDLRNVSSPLCILAGHERAVSYVKFLDSETIVSASTDNTLKLWDLKKTSFGCLSTNGCVLTFKGHTNEKNFVGLSVADGYIACGSETNEVFAYYRSLPIPITSHKFGSIDPISGKETDHGNNQFVSSVCWRQKSNTVIAANSSGCLKLLRMV